MPKINIDELVESIEVTVGGKTYTVLDISREVSKRITSLARQSDTLQRGIKRVAKQITDFEDSGDFVAADKAEKQLAELQEKEDGSNALEYMSTIMSDVLNADKADMAKLGLRKITMLVTKVMGAVNDEVEGKNVPKAVVKK